MKKISIYCCTFLFLSILFFASCDQECKHSILKENSLAPTCTENGETRYTCVDCGYTYLDKIIEPVGHKYTENKAEPDCTNDGYTVYTCQCGNSYVSDVVSAIGHSYTDTLKPADCLNGGYTTHICKTCGYSYISNHTDPTGHKIKSTVVAPTCTDEGFTLFACEKCDHKYTVFSEAPLGHSFKEEIISKADCTETGVIKYTCDCGEEYSKIISPLGHDFTKTVTMPTLSDMGHTEHVCKNCEFSYVGNYTFYSDILQNAYAGNSEVVAKGIDISHHNYKMDANGYVSLDWDAIKASGVTYVIIRIGDAAIGIDPTFEKSYAEAKAAGLEVGFYFYTRAQSVNEIRLEANLVASALNGKQFEYPVYLDLEDEEQMGIHSSVLNEMCIEFFSVLQGAGYYTGLYVNHEWLNNVVDTSSALSRFEVWYARYPETAEGEFPVWNVDENGEHLGMWQYSDAGIIDGIDDMIFDFNYCYKDYPTLIKKYGFNGYESDVKFQDDDKSFVWVVFDGDIIVRSRKDYFITDEYDASLDIIGYASKGTRFEVIERNDLYTAVKYNGEIAFISANLKYVSFEGIYFVSE